MKQGNKKIFGDKLKLTVMLNLRLNGLALSSLAWLFNCDRDSITKQCVKYGIYPNHLFTPNASDDDKEIFLIERIISQTIPNTTPTYKIVNGEKINLGKSYKEYVAASKYPPSKIWGLKYN